MSTPPWTIDRGNFVATTNPAPDFPAEQRGDKNLYTNTLLVLDSMTGQEAVSVAEQFQEAVDFDGVVLTKLDGDARGGAALSVKAVTGRPIKLISVGEKVDQLEYFHPDRMASRILDMGDMLTLIEQAEKTFDADQAGFNVDLDFCHGETFRVVQLTPPGSRASIIFGGRRR